MTDEEFLGNVEEQLGTIADVGSKNQAGAVLPAGWYTPHPNPDVHKNRTYSHLFYTDPQGAFFTPDRVYPRIETRLVLMAQSAHRTEIDRDSLERWDDDSSLGGTYFLFGARIREDDGAMCDGNFFTLPLLPSAVQYVGPIANTPPRGRLNVLRRSRRITLYGEPGFMLYRGQGEAPCHIHLAICTQTSRLSAFASRKVLSFR